MKKQFVTNRNTFTRDDSSDDSWMLSYSDMMTLLFAFFALLLALSDVNPVKMQIISEAMNKAIGGANKQPRVSLAQIQSDLEEIVQEESLQDFVNVSQDLHGVALSLVGSSFFQSGSTELLDSSLPFLSKIAGQIEKVPYQIAIEGHTDNVPMHSERFPSNWELSSARASTVVRYFVNSGVSSEQLRAIGYADIMYSLILCAVEVFICLNLQDIILKQLHIITLELKAAKPVH